MDPTDYFIFSALRPFRRAVIVATIVCLWYLVRLWRKGELYGLQLRVFALWLVAALVIPLASRSVWVWIAGLIAVVALAILLVLKDQWSDVV